MNNICDIITKNRPYIQLCTALHIHAIAPFTTMDNKGLAIIQQRYDKATKRTWWGDIDPWLTDAIYLHSDFKKYFDERSGTCKDGLYPTVTIRQIMWALKIKPIQKERWETTFDRRHI